MTNDIAEWLDDRIAFLEQASDEGADVADVEEAFRTVRRFVEEEEEEVDRSNPVSPDPIPPNTTRRISSDDFSGNDWIYHKV